MRSPKGFSIVEVLIIVAIISIIASIAVPSILTSRMAENEIMAVRGLRTIRDAELKYAAEHSGTFTDLKGLASASLLNSRFIDGFSGYVYQSSGEVLPTGFNIKAIPVSSRGRYTYQVSNDMIIRYVGPVSEMEHSRYQPGDPVD